MKVIKLATLSNCRDIGGVKLSDGTTLPYNKYFRSTSLHRLSKKDTKTLVDKYHLKTIIDLRTGQEVWERPDKVIEGVTYYHIPLYDDQVSGLTRDKKSRNLKTLRTMPDMKELYRALTSKESLDNINKVLFLILDLSEDQLPVLFHCSAGKDRTGIISALLLKHFGASQDDIYADYLATNKGYLFINNFKAWAVGVLGFSEKLRKKVKSFLIADRKYLEEFFNSLPDNNKKNQEK